MTRTIHISLLLTFSAICLFSSCGNDAEKSTTADVSQDSLNASQSGKDDNGAEEIFSLPAPMQIASAIKKNCPNYYAELLSPLKNTASSNFSKALNLGIYAVDLGYANVYDQKQTSINYFLTSVKMADELKITGAVDPSLLKLFKENINNKDSVTRYTLSSFGNIHDHLITSNRNEEAFLILTGSFIEGVYLSSKIQEINKDKNLVQLVGEQKIFLESLLSIFSSSSNKEIGDLCTQLADLKTAYDKVDIAYVEKEANKKNMQPIQISDDVLKQIGAKILVLRNSIIQSPGA
jgi:hypothetical protein